ncbi:MAG: carboxypeptidase regulatory-like domain-containing protein [Bryobacteraceae bacterium]|nr:carboxypeptidase regulatory-like domain-containing protein [Bryobacteraceae bacterium]
MATFLAATCGFAQSFTASVRGTVTDESSASIGAAKIVVTDAERGTNFTTNTDETGRFAVTALPPGKYVLAVEAAGFKRFSSGNFSLSVQEQATINAKLSVGDVSTTVEVQGAAAMVNTTISNLGQVIENRYILQLPNLGRNSMSLAYLTPGVVGSGGRRGDNNTNFSANGSRNSTSDVLVDGVTVTTVEQNSGITDLKFSPSVDTVQEFKMQTNFFSAEYGQTGGAVVNMVTRSGTNNFHGTGYYFMRDAALNSNDWFANRAGRAIPAFHRDQYGGVIGGPVIKNKTFFFFGYEYTKQESPTSANVSLPTALQRAGNFSQTFNASGQLMTIHNPFDTFTNAQGNVERRPLAGNIVPQSMMDPIALKAQSFLPTPNQPGAAFTNTANWFGQGVNTSDNQQMTIKGDHAFGSVGRLSGRYSRAPSKGTNPNLFGAGNPTYWTGGPNRTLTQAMVLDYTHVLNSTSLFTFRYGKTHSDFSRLPLEGLGFDVTTLGLPANMRDTATHKVFPRFAPEGFQEFGTEGFWIMDRQESVQQYVASMTKIWGGHNMKFGGERRFNILDYNQPGNPSGRFNFARGATCRLINSCGGNEGNGLATMLLGWATGSDYHIEPKAFSRSAYWGFYFQDDWKVTNRLTLNLGVRYDFDVPRWETQNRYSYLDLDANSPVTLNGTPLKGVLKFNDDKNRSPFKSDMNNFQPRIGFAYAATPKTAIRAGYGLFYTLSRATVFGRPGTGFTINSPVVWTTDSNATLNRRMSNPFPDGILRPPGRAEGDRTLLGFGIGSPVPDFNRNPEYHSWNLSIQRELPGQSVLEMNYTGSRGTHLFMPITTLSPLSPNYWMQGGSNYMTRTQLQAQVPNPFFGQITDARSQLSGRTAQQFRLLRPYPQYDGLSSGTAEPARGDSNYHALQVKWEKRYARGFTALTHYTWSKMIDNVSHSSGNVSWLGGSTSIQNIWDLRGERALSSHDVAHRAVITGMYELPFGQKRKFGSNMNRIMDAIVGGWNVSGVMLMQSGVPLQVTQSGGNIWDGTQRPNLIGDPSTSGRVQDRLNGWFNPAAFAQPAIDVPGSAPRNLNYRGPGIKTLDAALLKSVNTWEGQRFEFRLEATNVTNTPMFGDPGGLAFGSTNFGQITGLRNGVGPRNMQIGLKYYF